MTVPCCGEVEHDAVPRVQVTGEAVDEQDDRAGAASGAPRARPW